MSKNDLAYLEKSIGHAFKNKELLLKALTHKSFSHENPDKAPVCNERLEFLGDSVLGFVIVEHLFSIKREFTESFMSKTKSYLVQESVLSEISNSLLIGKYLRLGKGEEATGGRIKKSLLADAIEAVFGAVYLDGGYKKAKELILKLFREKINEIITSGEFSDFKTELQENTQLQFGAVPEYKLVKQEGKEHKKIFTVEVYINGKKFGTGCGKSKKEAETLAAKEAIYKLTF
jgi:ribonuclease-3